jgi:hypothetical protein
MAFVRPGISASARKGTVVSYSDYETVTTARSATQASPYRVAALLIVVKLALVAPLVAGLVWSLARP